METRMREKGDQVRRVSAPDPPSAETRVREKGDQVRRVSAPDPPSLAAARPGRARYRPANTSGKRTRRTPRVSPPRAPPRAPASAATRSSGAVSRTERCSWFICFFMCLNFLNLLSSNLQPTKSAGQADLHIAPTPCRWRARHAWQRSRAPACPTRPSHLLPDPGPSSARRRAARTHGDE